MGVVNDLYISITNINAKRITGFESATDYPFLPEQQKIIK